MIAYIQAVAQRKHGIRREIPIHVLIETHGALHDAWEIAALPCVQVLDFGLMDFVSGHHGAIPPSAMRSPGPVRAPAASRAPRREVVAAALAHGVVPAHNVSLDLKNTVQRLPRRLARAQRVRLPAHVEHLPGADPADRRRDEARHCARSPTRPPSCSPRRRADWGPIQYEGELHDRATYRYFWELLQKARVTGVRDPRRRRKAFF